MQELFDISNRLINKTSNEFVRGLYSKIDWTQPLIEIRGSRGVGKTTLMLQKAKEIKSKGYQVLYVSLVLHYFFKNSLFEFIHEFVKHGG